MKLLLTFILSSALNLTCMPSFASQYAGFLDPHAAAKEGLPMPAADESGRVTTLNNKGGMCPEIDLISDQFIKRAANPGAAALEIGAAYGCVCLAALELGAQNYTANDMEIAHLKILANRIGVLRSDYLNYIKLAPGSFPDEVGYLPGGYDAILIARVLHFMTPDEALKCLEHAYAMLKPGGKIYAVTLSPYVKCFERFIPEFEDRVAKNIENPGYVENLEDWADDKIKSNPGMKDPKKPFLFSNVASASKLFERVGFVVEECIEFPLEHESDVWQLKSEIRKELNGRENVGIIARKEYLL